MLQHTFSVPLKKKIALETLENTEKMKKLEKKI
jgi:hypothetical protein